MQRVIIKQIKTAKGDTWNICKTCYKNGIYNTINPHFHSRHNPFGWSKSLRSLLSEGGVIARFTIAPN